MDLVFKSKTKLSKGSFLFIFIVILALFLHFFLLTKTMYLIGDFGWYYLEARDLIMGKRFPLVGISSSVPVLRQGAIWTWLLAVALKLGNFNPLFGAYLSTLLGVMGVLGSYFLLEKYKGKITALIISTILAVSPFVVLHDRMPFQTSAIFPATLLIFWSAQKTVEGAKNHLFLLGIWFSLIYQLELAGIILIPIVFISFIWQRLKLSFKDFLTSFAGFFIGLTPFWIWDLKNGVFIQTLGFGAWLVIKLYESTVGFFTNTEQFASLYNGVDILNQIIFAPNKFVSIGLFLMTCLFLFWGLLSKQIRLNFSEKFMFIWLFLGIVSFFIRGIFSEAYIPLIYLPLVFCLGIFIDYLFRNFRSVGSFTLAFIILTNSFYIFNSIRNPKFVTYEDRLTVANFIINDSKGKDFKLKYLGPNYQFYPGDYHWRYLLWWLGNEPRQKSDLVYTIYEIPYEPEERVDYLDFGKIKVERKI